MAESLLNHFNAIGSTVAMSDMNQTIVNSYSYDPFGNILNQNETIPQPFKYVGQYGVMYEPNGFYLMVYRYYDPKVGRFISEDPIGFAGGTVNLYQYAKNSPIRYIDPFGLFDIIVIDKGGRNGDTYGGIMIVVGDSGKTALVNASSLPNPTNPNPGISEGTYDATYSVVAHHGNEPGVVLEDYGRIPTEGPNPAQGGQNWATEIEIHCGDSPSNRGSSGCITIQPEQCQDVWNILQNGETGQVTINRRGYVLQ